MLINNSWHIISPQKGLAILITGASFPGASVVKNLPANARDVVDVDSIPGSRRSPGGGNGNPLQHSCLKNPMNMGAWRATVQGLVKSQTRLTVHEPTLTYMSLQPLEDLVLSFLYHVVPP